MSKEFVIVCPGKSLADHGMDLIYKIPWAEADGVIAVNGGIKVPILFDYWMFQDFEVFRTLQQMDHGILYCHGRPLARFGQVLRLLVPQRMPNDIRAEHKDLVETFFKFDIEMMPGYLVEDFSHAMPFGNGLPWREYTMLAAIGMSIMKGAGVIRIYGADMHGSGYHQPGLENDRTQHDQVRWEAEKALYKAIVEQAARHGVQITREVL